MELQLIKWIQSFQTEWLDQIFIAATMLGEEFFIIALLSFSYWCVDKQNSRYLVLILGLSVVTNGALKELFNHARPIGEEGVRSIYTDTASGHSFPSGHTQTATAFFAGAMTLFKNRLFRVVAVILIFLVAISRIYLGVHWPIDVVGGILFGVASVILGRKIYRYCEKYRVFWPYFIILFLAIGSLFIFESSNYLKAVGVLGGFFFGYFIEENYLDFDVRAPLIFQALKYIVGLGFTGFIFLGLKVIMPEGVYWEGIRYFITVVFVIAGAPAIFRMLSWSRKRIF